MRSGRWNENWQGKPKYSEKTCPSATLSTTNPTRFDLGSNSDHRGGKLATNRLSYGTALKAEAVKQLSGSDDGLTPQSWLACYITHCNSYPRQAVSTGPYFPNFNSTSIRYTIFSNNSVQISKSTVHGARTGSVIMPLTRCVVRMEFPVCEPEPTQT
jgi:hypothetical protein